MNFGEDLGMVVKRNDEDVNREVLKTQFTLNIKTTDGMTTPISLTGYHTNNSMLIQLLGNKTEKKVGYLGHFVNNILVDIISKVEQSDEHRRVKEMLKEHFRQAQYGLEDGVRPSILRKIVGADDENDVRKKKMECRCQNTKQNDEVGETDDTNKKPVNIEDGSGVSGDTNKKAVDITVEAGEKSDEK